MSETLLVRYRQRETTPPLVGLREGSEVSCVEAPSLGALLGLSVAEIRTRLEAASHPVPVAEVTLLAPIDGRTEVWAAGVTYARSRDARIEESLTSDVYTIVYDSERPELFFKAAAWRVVTDAQPIAIRADSALNVPEAELAIVANAAGEIVGWTVCNDVTSRSIEGANPLYLPQAKIYAGSCALATGIRPAWELDASTLEVSVKVLRAGLTAWSGTVSTEQLRREPSELIRHLFAGEQFPEGVILATGTGIVPEIEFTLLEGDEVLITIDEVGTLRNPVRLGKAGFDWLATRS